jgi:hypothetical protein
VRLIFVGLIMAGSFYSIGQTKSPTAKSATTPAKTTTSAVKAPAQKSTVKAQLPQLEIAAQIVKGQSEFSFLGTYTIFAGIQKLPIGTCTLKDDGTYTVSVNSDASNYGQGIYEYNSDAKNLIWKGGLFVTNKYNGTIVKSGNGKIRILLSKSTYAEKIN